MTETQSERNTVYDYVIAGGGTAGCIVAARLSEDPDITVCLLEAGPSDLDDPNILVLSEWMHLLDSGYDWDYPVEPQEKGNGFLRHARAKVLGGCSSHNSCIAFWPLAKGLRDWETMGATGWGPEGVLPYTAKVENNTADGTYQGVPHGHSGPVRLRDVPPNDPCGQAVIDAAAQVGLETVQFNRDGWHLNAAGWLQINANEAGERMSSSHAYLHPILGSRPNLTVLTDSWVAEILFDDSGDQPVATGVRYQRPDLSGYDVVTATREVIVTPAPSTLRSC
jgi:choline oxidase